MIIHTLHLHILHTYPAWVPPCMVCTNNKCPELHSTGYHIAIWIILILDPSLLLTLQISTQYMCSYPTVPTWPTCNCANILQLQQSHKGDALPHAEESCMMSAVKWCYAWAIVTIISYGWTDGQLCYSKWKTAIELEIWTLGIMYITWLQ